MDLIAPTSAFSANVTSGCSPLAVAFTDSSTGSPTSWSWDIDGDGDEDYNTQNPIHEFSSPGTYSVNLKAINDCGSDWETRPVI